MKLFIGNLPFSVTDEEVRELFSPYGEIVEVNLIKDRFSGKPRGFGFVELKDDEMANKAIAELNDKDLGGRKIVVNVAQEKREQNPRESNRGGYDQNRNSSWRR